MSLLDLYSTADAFPAGLPRDADLTSVVTGRLLGVDPERGLAQVSVAGADGVWVPAQPAIYTQGGAVYVQRSPLDGGRASACLRPVVGASMFAGGKVVAVNATVGLLTVDVLDSRVDLPYLPGTYSAGTLVHVLRSPQRLGLPEFVMGPSGGYNYQSPGQPGGGSSSGGSLVTRQAVILPQWSGSWRASYGRWDTWNTSRYGGRSTLWQGNGYGSGPMTGLAVYGDQIVNLGAASIDAMTVAVYRADDSVSSGKVPVVQPSPNGTQPGGAPSIVPVSAVAGPALAPGQGATVALPAGVLDGFRTGAYKGLAMVGSDYAGFSGTPDKAPVHADGMALVVTYKVVG